MAGTSAVQTKDAEKKQNYERKKSRAKFAREQMNVSFDLLYEALECAPRTKEERYKVLRRAALTIIHLKEKLRTVGVDPGLKQVDGPFMTQAAEGTTQHIKKRGSEVPQQPIQKLPLPPAASSTEKLSFGFSLPGFPLVNPSKYLNKHILDTQAKTKTTDARAANLKLCSKNAKAIDTNNPPQQRKKQPEEVYYDAKKGASSCSHQKESSKAKEQQTDDEHQQNSQQYIIGQLSDENHQNSFFFEKEWWPLSDMANEDLLWFLDNNEEDSIQYVGASDKEYHQGKEEIKLASFCSITREKKVQSDDFRFLPNTAVVLEPSSILKCSALEQKEQALADKGYIWQGPEKRLVAEKNLSSFVRSISLSGVARAVIEYLDPFSLFQSGAANCLLHTATAEDSLWALLCEKAFGRSFNQMGITGSTPRNTFFLKMAALMPPDLPGLSYLISAPVEGVAATGRSSPGEGEGEGKGAGAAAVRAWAWVARRERGGGETRRAVRRRRGAALGGGDTTVASALEVPELRVLIQNLGPGRIRLDLHSFAVQPRRLGSSPFLEVTRVPGVDDPRLAPRVVARFASAAVLSSATVQAAEQESIPTGEGEHQVDLSILECVVISAHFWAPGCPHDQTFVAESKSFVFEFDIENSCGASVLHPEQPLEHQEKGPSSDDKDTPALIISVKNKNGQNALASRKNYRKKECICLFRLPEETQQKNFL